MKITKTQLRNIIREEIKSLNEISILNPKALKYVNTVAKEIIKDLKTVKINNLKKQFKGGATGNTFENKEMTKKIQELTDNDVTKEDQFFALVIKRLGIMRQKQSFIYIESGKYISYALPTGSNVVKKYAKSS